MTQRAVIVIFSVESEVLRFTLHVEIHSAAYLHRNTDYMCWNEFITSLYCQHATHRTQAGGVSMCVTAGGVSSFWNI